MWVQSPAMRENDRDAGLIYAMTAEVKMVGLDTSL
jgi:hypothetical protein